METKVVIVCRILLNFAIIRPELNQCALHFSSVIYHALAYVRLMFCVLGMTSLFLLVRFAHLYYGTFDLFSFIQKIYRIRLKNM